MIQDMASSKQTEDGRRSYTLCAAALLDTYPAMAPRLLFSDDAKSSKPIASLFVKMVQVDILSTLHVLIPKLNTIEYPSISRRIAAALDIVTSFVGFLMTAEDDSTVQKSLTPDLIIKIHEELVRTIGDVMEYLRDRWDDYLTGARGIESSQISKKSIFEDPITPAAIRLLATWLRDDDGDALRAQASGLTDLFAELYKMNITSTDFPELRLPILAALEGTLQTPNGQDAFNTNELWSRCFYPDLRTILTSQDEDLTAGDYIRGSAIVHIYFLMEYHENPQSHPASMDLTEYVAKLHIRPVNAEADASNEALVGFQTDAVELAVTLLENSSRTIPTAQIKADLKEVAAKIMENWRVLNNENMVARLAGLNLG